ncbi:TORTIFOLIA1-like protein 4 isoform X2 [Daucus carota subsp. sativus]|uniref:TORTIFOLIA1-like protein 4 isoform X2 n=1 Tax=Daucus carota subsp. sativus TaxID=79200 RepID=UPI0007F03A6E|nr:PREDICTED: microtubule-associated protein TORTIFOLIA1-like isoform X2 [Daucus carota subsp. sativus]
MAALKQSTNQATMTREFKQRVLTCLNKLSDRDTYSAASVELESIARTLSHDSLSPFISSITATDSADKSPVRKQCVKLVSLLSESHGNLLSPHLSKLISSVIRRLRDNDSAVRSACVAAIGSISSHITKPPFTSIAKPLIDALVTEQDLNSQIGAALCVAAAIDGAPDPDPVFLKRLLPRLEKLLRSESFKAKAALLTVFGSVIGANGSLSQQIVRNFVKCFVEFVGSEDWAARKAAAEALVKLAVVERDVLPEYKASCLKTFEAKRHDKVKVVREAMTLMVEAWREIPDALDEVSPLSESQSSSKVPSNGRYAPGLKSTRSINSRPPQMSKNNGLPLLDYSSAAIASKRNPPEFTEKKTGPAMFRKLDRKKPPNRKIETATPVSAVVSEDFKFRNEKFCNKDGEEINRVTKVETRRELFSRNSEENTHNFDGSKAGSSLHLCDEVSDYVAKANNVVGNHHGNHKESEDLLLIRKQLLQIENQQSTLFDLLQGFIGTSQNSMRSLESRVHGLELSLEEISLDLAVSAGRISGTRSAGTTCCKLPVADFLYSKLWRRAEGNNSASTEAIRHNMAIKNGSKLENRRARLQNSSGFIVNPLAEVHGNSQGISEIVQNST